MSNLTVSTRWSDLTLKVAVRAMDNIDVVVEVEDATPTVGQIVAYERFWKMVVERLVRGRESKKQAIEDQVAEKLAA